MGPCFFVVRMEGLEPPCLAALDPKSSASTNFATSAMGLQKYLILFSVQTITKKIIGV
jgi:hypothetical protein